MASDLDSIDYMARTAWGEARGEGTLGMRAVSHVIHNRVQSRRYPSTVREVVLQPWQFSAWNAADPNRAKMLALDETDPAFRAALDIAREVLRGGSADPTGGALHYHATSVSPSWAATATGGLQIGKHIFLTGVA